MEQNVKVKIAISLKILLERRKSNSNFNGKEESQGDSYNTIALNADMRKATVSNVFNAISNPNSTTLIMIVEAMGFNLTDFAKIYCTIGEEEIKKFLKDKL